MQAKRRMTIIGAGNIGTAIANGLVDSGRFKAADVTLTRRSPRALDALKERGFDVESDNRAAVRRSDVALIAVEPQQFDAVAREIAPDLQAGRHVLISVVTGVDTRQIRRHVGEGVTVVRAMPNTAIAVRESMTCLASNAGNHEALDIARSIFDTVGRTLVIEEEEMIAATALCACGIAFFLRAIRAASQGGIEIGFHSQDALAIAAQTAKGAATLLQSMEHHPEYEIDRVTTPRGCTIAGLNRMEHEGFSSAMIRGITTSAERAARLYRDNGGDE
jgi:pyrroline-5-carboxylate reductase